MTGGASTPRERRMEPVTAITQAVCILAAVWMLWLVSPRKNWLAWSAVLLCWALPTASNLRYAVSHRRANIGMMPLAMASLAGPAALALVFGEVGVIVRVVLWAILIGSCATIAILAVWFRRFRAMGSNAHAIQHDAIIVVLGGTIRDGKPCLTLQIRLDEALRLWQESPERKLLLTGGLVRGETRTEADYMAEYLVERGVPSTSLLLERKARDTRQNIRLSLELLREASPSGELPDEQLCVLTNDYHLYRAVAEGRAEGVELTPISCPTPPTSRLQQWSREVLAMYFGH